MKTPAIRVVALTRVDHPRVIAKADVQIGDLCVFPGIRLIKDNAVAPLRIQGPQVSWIDESGTRQYVTSCTLRKPLRVLIIAAIVARLEREGVAL